MSRWKLIGGRLCLDFVNTVSWRGRPEPEEKLRNVDDLLRWSRHAGLAVSRAGRPVLDCALELREAIHRLLLAWAGTRKPRPGDLAVLNRAMPSRDRLDWNRGSFEWKSEVDRILGPIAWSAADLLTTGEPRRLKRCGSEECGWLFYDESVNGMRRWCSMNDCGNREKARRHYARKSKAAGRP